VDWDVQGLPVRTFVGSIRHVEWRRLEPNFFVVFPEGVLEGAPKTFLAAVHVSLQSVHTLMPLKRSSAPNSAFVMRLPSHPGPRPFISRCESSAFARATK
jgi:predicted lysophospholipase L1 biosynthesis ABC-type transport system permease subunit